MVGIWSAFKTGYDSETAWRLSFLVPASIVLLVSIGQLYLSDDCPKGNYKELEQHGALDRKKPVEAFKKVGPQPTLARSVGLAVSRVGPHAHA